MNNIDTMSSNALKTDLETSGPTLSTDDETESVSGGILPLIAVGAVAWGASEYYHHHG
jgi:hypothetical protein